MSETEPAIPVIYGLMPKVMASIGAVGKDARNAQQNYSFRSVEAIYGAVHGALAEHSVFYTAEPLSVEAQERQTSGGKVMLYVTMKIRYRFFAPDGSWVEHIEYGSGADIGDKAYTKAQTNALKYCLIRVFAIPVEGDTDGDQESPELSEPVASDLVVQELQERIGDLPIAFQEGLRDWWKSEKLRPLGRITESEAVKVLGHVKTLEDQAARHSIVEQALDSIPPPGDKPVEDGDKSQAEEPIESDRPNE